MQTTLTVKGGGQPESRPTNGRQALDDRATRPLLTCPWCKHKGRNGKDFLAYPAPCGNCGRPIQSGREQCRHCGKIFTMTNITPNTDVQRGKLGLQYELESVPQNLLNRRYRCPWCSIEGSIGNGLAISGVNCRRCGEPRVDVPKGSVVLQCGCGQISVLNGDKLLRYSREDY